MVHASMFGVRVGVGGWYIGFFPKGRGPEAGGMCVRGCAEEVAEEGRGEV